MTTRGVIVECGVVSQHRPKVLVPVPPPAGRMPPSPATVPPSVRMCRANVDTVAPPTLLESNQNNPRRRAPQCRRAETLNARSSACASRRFTRRVEDGLEGGACRRWAADAVRTSSTRPIGPEKSRSRSEAREAGADATSRRASVTMSELACGGTARSATPVRCWLWAEGVV